MKILSMTATFGKLSQKTLTLKPGLNLIHAPNEWGKSTWCAFLVAMLYGIDTRERSTAAALADKQRYAPWSGEPMSGRMDIHYNGKEITIERSTKGRVPFGEFRAYETQTGLPVTQLTAANCGQVLLGVEKSVFIRSGFVRLTDMPVTQDEALRRRLNALVTTGDESGTGDALAQKLRDLKNKCRHNKTGLLPQAEAERDKLVQALEQHSQLQNRLEQIQSEQQTLQQQLDALHNHRQALEYAAAKEGLQRLEQANTARQTALDNCEQHNARCRLLPTEEFAAKHLQQLRTLQTRQAALDAEVPPALPHTPDPPEVFKGCTPDGALRKAQEDKAAYEALCKPIFPFWLILAILSAAAGIGLMLLQWYLLLPALLLGVLALFMHLRGKKQRAAKCAAITAQYSTPEPQQWHSLAQQYFTATKEYEANAAAAKAISASLEERRQKLRSDIHDLTQGLTLVEAIQKWEQVLSEHKACAHAQQVFAQADSRVADLSAAIKTAEPPAAPDALTLSPEETDRAIQAATAQLQHLQLQAGQYIGQRETLGTQAALEQQLQALNARIVRLEDAYNALGIAMKTLEDASDALQRRFAPRIASYAQSLFARLTGGRYDRLQLSQDLSLNTAARDEVGLQSALWRSDGTVDQLYLALRLAVANALIPEAPLVLDDALVRFDDTRLQAALEILREEAGGKQVILFTCQSREAEYLPECIINI